MRAMWAMTIAVLGFWWLGPLTALAAQPDEADLRALRNVVQEIARAMGAAKEDFELPRGIWEIAPAQLRAGDIGGALQTARAFGGMDSALRDSIFVEIAGAQADRGAIPGAFRTAEGIEVPEDKAGAFLRIGLAQAKAGDHAGAAKTFQRALKASAAIEDSLVRDQVLGDLATAKARSGDVNGALEMAAMINDEKERHEAFISIGVAQGQAGDVWGALQTASAIPYSRGRADPLRELAKPLIEAGDEAGIAMTLLRAIRSATPNQDAARDLNLLLQLAEEQAEAGDRPAAGETLEEALWIVFTLPDGPARGDALDAIAGTWSRIGGVAAATALKGVFQAADATRGDGERALAFASIALAQINVGDRQGASESLERALQAIATVLAESHRTDRIFALIALVHAGAGEVGEAIQAAEQVRDPMRRAHDFLNIAEVKQENGDPDGAQFSIQEALKVAFSLQSQFERDDIQRRASCLQAKRRDEAAALQTLAGIEDDVTRVYALIDMATAQEGAGDRGAAEASLQRAIESAAAISHEADKTELIMKIAEGWFHIAGLPRALAWANSQDSPRLKTAALIGVALGLRSRVVERLEPADAVSLAVWIDRGC